MIDDRTLLEKAARAAGLVVHDVSSRGLWVYQVGSELNWEGEYPIFDWNPLTDDGDALRLAVKRIDLVFHGDHLVAWYQDFFGTGMIPYGDDPYAATRRAIVMAAASLGSLDEAGKD